MSVRRVFLAVAHLSLAVGPAFADDPGLREAQQAFRNGTNSRADEPAARGYFREAARAYWNAIAAEHYRTPGSWRMYGNSLLLSGNVPRAVYAYRCGLALDPDDEGLRRGLDLAR